MRIERQPRLQSVALRRDELVSQQRRIGREQPDRADPCSQVVARDHEQRGLVRWQEARPLPILAPAEFAETPIEVCVAYLWGDYMIQSTADGEEPSIKSAVMAAAVRVNLHMIAQAGFENPVQIHLGDELVGEDL